MGRTSTAYIDLSRIQMMGDSANLIIRLMMACNDLSVANVSYGYYMDSELIENREIKKGASLYFVKIQCGHLYEGMKLIEEIVSDSYMLSEVDKCSHSARESFDNLKKCLKGGEYYDEFTHYIELVRHNTAFHYDSKKLVDRALF